MTRGRVAAVAVGLLLLAGAAAAAGSLEARVDRRSLAPGETLGLVLRLRGAEGEPDLAPLERDFDVLDVQQSRRTTVVDGRRDDSVEWWIALSPRRAGALEIPALRAGDAESGPIALRVGEAADPDAASGGAGTRAARSQPFSVELTIDEPHPYVQQQVLLSLRLRSETRILDGALGEPSVEGAILSRTGEDVHERREIDGRRYDVFERQYALFPQRSGEIRIPPVTFEGHVAEPAGHRRERRDPFAERFGGGAHGGLGFGSSFFDDLFRGRGPRGSLLEELFSPDGRRVRARSRAVSLDVAPRPEAAGTGEWWLPAENVQIVEKWGSEPPRLRVGVPVERTLEVQATGLSGSQLPDLDLPELDGARQYREPSVDDTFQLKDSVVAIRRQKTALIPTRPGPLTLPALELAWWDTAADAPRTARLPARTLEVLPGDPASAAPPAAAADVPPTAPPAAEPGVAPADDGAPEGPGRWTPLTGGALAGALAGLLAVAALLGRRRRRRPTAHSARAGVRAAERALRDACAASDPRAAAAALRALALARWPQAAPVSPAEWSARLGSAPLAAAVETLERARYAPGSSSWDGATLWKAYRRARGADRSRPRSAPRQLPSLYPSG